MTTPNRSQNPDRFRRRADVVHDGEVSPGEAKPGISRQNLEAIKQPEKPRPRNRQAIRQAPTGNSQNESSGLLDEIDRIFFQRLFGNNLTAGQEDWLGTQRDIISFLQGSPAPSSSIPSRAYPLEKIPADPEVSSPWHNAIYESFQPLYEWGARSFCIFWQNGGFTTVGTVLQNNGLAMTMRKQTFTSAGELTPFEQSPAMWMGYPQAVRALIEGAMAPQGRPAMPDPCNVMLYWEGFAGDPIWRNRTQEIWDSLGSTAAERDTAYKALLDDLLDDFKAMRGRTDNSGKLYVVIDVGAQAATPNTLSLFRQLANSRSDIHELSDWYIATELEKAGIEVFVEARPLAQRSAPRTSLGVISNPELTDSEWRKFSSGYYWFRFSDPDLGDPNYTDFVTNEQAGKIFHIQDSNYPVQASKEPLGGTHVVQSGSASRNLLLDYAANRVMYYTPHYRLDALYNIADNYRHHQNLRLGFEKNKGTYVKVPALMAIGHEIFAGGNVHYAANNGSSLTEYTRIPYSALDSFRPAFNKTSFLADPAAYSEGYWTSEGNTYWDTQVRRPSFQEFVQFLDSFTSLAAPPAARFPVMRNVDVYVSELPDEARSEDFAAKGAKRCSIVPQEKANQINNAALGTIDSQEFLNRIAGTGGLTLGVNPSVLESDLVLLDFHSPYVLAAQLGPLYTGTPPGASVTASMRSCLQALKAAYPAKKWMFIDVPKVEAFLCEVDAPVDPDCQGNTPRIDLATAETRDFNARWLFYQAEEIAEDSDGMAPVLRQRVRIWAVLNDDDQVDRIVAEDSAASAMLVKQESPQKLVVAVVPLTMKSIELLSVGSNSGVVDFTFSHPQQLISNCIKPALEKGADAVVFHHPWSEHSNLLFSALAAVGNPTRTQQLNIRSAYAARFMRNQTVSSSDDAFWQSASTAQTIVSGLSQHMLDLVERTKRLQGGSIESPSWGGNVYPNDYVSIQVLPADINSSSSSLGENQKVWAPCWTNNNLYGSTSNGVKITDVVPLVNVPAPERPGGPGVALSGSRLDNLVQDIMSRPAGRRAILPTYWMYESPPNEILTLNNFYAATSDGTTYTGNVVGFGDPSPLRFMTPWAYNSTNDCAASISATIEALKQRGAEINMICDDWEAWSGLGLASVYNTYDGPFDANGLPLNWTTGSNNWKTVPDPRRTGAVVNDSRFGSLPVYDGKSFGELIFDNYQAIQAQFGITVPTPQDKIAEIRSLLEQYTDVTSRQDFRAPWYIGTDQARAVWHAFDAALETLTNQQHNLGKWASLVDYRNDTKQAVPYYNYGVYPMSAVEGRYVFEANGHYMGPRPSFIPSIGAAPVLYGELVDGYFTGRGYTPSPTTDVQRFTWVPGGVPMPSITYMAFVMDCVRLRGMLRSQPDAWTNLAPWINSPASGSADFSRYPADPRYFFEICYHALLAGSKMIQYYNRPQADDHFMQKALNEWSRVSNDKKVRPCSNLAGSVSQPVNRLQLDEAAKMVISGGAVVGSLAPKYIWRITVAPNVVSLTRTNPAQTDLPPTIATSQGSDDNNRGVWLVRTVPGMPAYSATTV